jgi:hypothetical protein
MPTVAVAALEVVLVTTMDVTRFTVFAAGVKPVRDVVPLYVQDVVAEVPEGIT